MTALLAGLGLFALLTLLEWFLPDRKAHYERWFANLGWGAITLACTRLASFMAPLAAALWAQEAGFGLLNQVDLPGWADALLVIILLDCAVYWQHRLFHRVGWLWRWHALHHVDEALDLSTSVRFHPIEGLISLAWKAACAALLGAPPWAVPLFEFWLMAGSLVEHSNIRLPQPVDKVMRWFVVTPAMHRVHHSPDNNDTNHNYGFAIAIWDRLFGSYRATHSGERIGLPDG